MTPNVGAGVVFAIESHIKLSDSWQAGVNALYLTMRLHCSRQKDKQAADSVMGARRGSTR